MTSLVWFRQDLRLADNPALAHAARRGPVVPVYVLDESPAPFGRSLGGASRWWLHHSLTALSKSLGGLVLLRGDPAEVLAALARRTGATGVYWNRCYEPYAVARDKTLKMSFAQAGIDVASFNGSLMFEPWQVQTINGGPYKVFSPFWRACLRLAVATARPMVDPVLAPISGLGDRLSDWQLLPVAPNWAQGFAANWTPGEVGAHDRLDTFLATGLSGYSELRNRPDLPNVSRLSPHLHWGEISPRQIYAATHALLAADVGRRKDAEKFIAELGWREFAYHLLYHFPTLPDRNWKPGFDAYPWQVNARHRAPGNVGKPATRSSMPACANFGQPATCTIACEWSWPAS